MAYDNTNRGSIWKNKKMREGKQDADFTGTLNVNGVEYWVNAWKRKEDASPDAPSLSFSIRPKEDQPQQSISQRAMPKRPDPISSGRSLEGRYWTTRFRSLRSSDDPRRHHTQFPERAPARARWSEKLPPEQGWSSRHPSARCRRTTACGPC
jgi:hypothetical protein